MREELKRVQNEVRALRQELTEVENERDQARLDLENRDAALAQANVRLSSQETEMSTEIQELRQQLATALSTCETSAKQGSNLEMWQKRCQELEEQQGRYREEIRELRENNERLSFRVVTEGLDCVDRSLAAQVPDIGIWPDDKDTTQLHKNLREQQDANRRLREYVGQLIVLIIEHNPSLLDVTNRSSPNDLDTNPSGPGLSIANSF